MSINSNFRLIGRLTADPRINTNGRGVQTAYLTIAVNEGYKDAQTGQWVDRTNYHDVVAFGDSFVSMIANTYHKGTLVAVDGSIGTRKLKLENGYEQSVPALRIDNLMKLSFNQGQYQGSDEQDFNSQAFENNVPQGGYSNLPPH